MQNNNQKRENLGRWVCVCVFKKKRDWENISKLKQNINDNNNHLFYIHLFIQSQNN